MARTVTEIGDELYQLAPQDFVTARTARAAEVRKAGDAATAKAVTALRRPTVAAWLVNLLALRRPDAVADWLDLAARMRQAQENLRGSEVRELSARRRQLLDALLAKVGALASAEGRPEAARLVRAEIADTLTAAFADEEIAAVVRAGRLTAAATYSGLGQVTGFDAGPFAQVPARTGVEPAARPAATSKPTVKIGAGSGSVRPAGRKGDTKDRRAAEAEAAAREALAAEREAARREAERAARDELREAEAALAEEVGAEAAALAEAQRLREDLAELRRRLTGAQSDLAHAESEAEAAARRRRVAERRVAAARRRADG